MSEPEAVRFKNQSGQVLFGTLHPAVRARQGLPAVVLLSPGVKMRVGPGRLYVPLTDMLNDLGYTVLRFDFFGLGDSEGELQEPMLADVYNNIEVGRYVGDTVSALDWLAKEKGFQRFVLGGLCGGAITALLAAERDSRVEGLLSLGMTVTLASNAATPAKYLTGAQLDSLWLGYMRRLREPQSWLRLLTFQTEYGALWRSMKRAFVKDKPRPKPVAPVAPVTPPAGNAAAESQRGNANPLFPRAFFAFLQRGGRGLMLFSEKDRLYSEYDEKFAQPQAARLQAYLSQLEHHVVPNANHVLSFTEWQHEMLKVCGAWLRKLHPA